jgi:hypothetical protein
MRIAHCFGTLACAAVFKPPAAWHRAPHQEPHVKALGRLKGINKFFCLSSPLACRLPLDGARLPPLVAACCLLLGCLWRSVAFSAAQALAQRSTQRSL